MIETGNQQFVKRLNKGIVLEMVKKYGPLSRAEISQKSGLNKGTVSSLVSDLIEEQLIYESGIGKSKGGRRPVMLLFNKTAGYSIGIDLGVNYILGTLTDLSGSLVTEKQTSFQFKNYGDLLNHLKGIIQELIAETPVSPYGVVGIGIGVPGIVDKNGKILMVPHIKWGNFELKHDIEEAYGLPVTMDNEANAGAYGEKKFGAGRKFNNLVYISAGIGIGVGLVLNGELYRGRNGFSGESGHMIIERDGKPCSCGSKGCWETYASENTLLKEAQSLNLKSDSGLTLESLISLADQGDEKVTSLFTDIGRNLGYGINNLINTFNPDQIIVGNRLAMAAKWIKEPIHKSVETHTLKYHQDNLEINFSELSIYSAALGMSAFATEQFLNRIKENSAVV
ncbi:ROK family transcriptional regulator [Bacillus marinisedimentorum]|uniref:ROK family transcriptional regulator n=1 Tax=Bacillus marinisedimentorum TaxID=1821260 RepID=UPI0007DE91AC|nr:ROK family transcriptional regulator [Bacillus marinisedimentorum]